MNGFITGKISESIIIDSGQRINVGQLVMIGLGKQDTFNKDQFNKSLLIMQSIVHNLNTSDVICALPGRPENHIESADAITWFLDQMNSIHYKCKTSLIEPHSCQAMMIPTMEKWRLCHTISL